MSSSNSRADTDRVAITGAGVLSPAGDTAATVAACVEARSAAGPIEAWDTEGFPVRFAAEVRNFDPTPWVPAREARRIHPVSPPAPAAATAAMEQAGLAGEDPAAASLDPARAAVIAGSGVGGILTLEDQIGA